jgi:cytochrome P450
VLAELFGLPESDRQRFGPWVQTLTRLQNEGFAADALLGGEGDSAAHGVEVIGEMFEYFAAAIARSRKSPRDDLLGALVSADVDGEHLSDWDILGFCFVVVAGGADTTASLISHTVQLTGDQMSQRELLLAEPSLVPEALVECLRLESSVQGLARTALENVVVAGVPIPAGEKVMMLYGSANHDPREFGETVDRLDVRRVVPRHLAFSSGPHFCIGSHLARLQARVAIEELLAAQPHIMADASAGTRHESAFVRGWVSLPAVGLESPG